VNMETTKIETLIINDISLLIEQNRQKLAVAVNTVMSDLYWHIGNRLKTHVLGNEKAAYGKAIIKNVSLHLTCQYGNGWSEKHLFHCLRCAEIFPDFEIFELY